MYQENTITHNDCPVCKKKEGARMGSTEWQHNVYCCSDECGLKIKDNIEKNTNTKKYRKMVKKYYKLFSKIHKHRLKGTGAHSEPFFNL